MPIADVWRAIVDWFRGFDAAERGGLNNPMATTGDLELPWRHRWDHLPKRTAGFGFTRATSSARRRASR